MYSKKSRIRESAVESIKQGVCFAVDDDDEEEDPDKKEFITFTGAGLRTPTLKGEVSSLKEGLCSIPD